MALHARKIEEYLQIQKSMPYSLPRSEHVIYPSQPAPTLTTVLKK